MTNNPSPSNLISSSTGDWEMVIGLEVHAQVTSKAKLFSGAATKFGAEPNSQVSLVGSSARSWSALTEASRWGTVR